MYGWAGSDLTRPGPLGGGMNSSSCASQPVALSGAKLGTGAVSAPDADPNATPAQSRPASTPPISMRGLRLPSRVSFDTRFGTDLLPGPQGRHILATIASSMAPASSRYRGRSRPGSPTIYLSARALSPCCAHPLLALQHHRRRRDLRASLMRKVGAPADPLGLRCGRKPAAGRGPSTLLSGRPNYPFAAAIPLARRCNGP